MSEKRLAPWAKLLAPVLAALAGLVALRLLGPDLLDQATLSSWIAPLGHWAPLAFVLFLTVRPVTLLPGQLFTAVGGILFGTLLGGVYATIGNAVANALVFGLALQLGPRFMQRLAKRKYPALRRVARRRDFQFSLLSAINPLMPTDIAVAACAAAGGRFWPTVGGVVLATLPGTFLTAQFGSALSQGKVILTVLSAAGLAVSLVLGAALGRRVLHEVNGEHARGAPPIGTLV